MPPILISHTLISIVPMSMATLKKDGAALPILHADDSTTALSSLRAGWISWLIFQTQAQRNKAVDENHPVYFENRG
jgi:hypothetical protein